MNTLKMVVKRLPVIREVVTVAIRFKRAFGYFTGPLRELIVWLFKSRETTNFTYDLTPINKCYLAALIADITGNKYDRVASYIAELEDDKELRAHIRAITQTSDERLFADLDARYGRRLGWYAFVRATKPKIVIETGVDKGLGSCVITAALRRNDQEGYAGYYYGTDINPRAGYLLSGVYRKYGEILFGDSLTSLENLDKTVDLFINDSDHSASYEEKEYEVVSKRASPQAIFLADNAHVTDKLFKFSLATGRQFIFFSEKPYRHWYPGEGIGIAFRRNLKASA